MTPYQRILVPCDFSPVSNAALEHACELAEAAPAELQVLHVVPDSLFPLAPALPSEEQRRQAAQRLESLLTPHSLLKLRTKFTVRQDCSRGRDVFRIAARSRIPQRRGS